MSQRRGVGSNQKLLLNCCHKGCKLNGIQIGLWFAQQRVMMADASNASYSSVGALLGEDESQSSAQESQSSGRISNVFS